MVDHEVESSGHESQAHADFRPMFTSNLGPLHALVCLELFFLFLGATGALRAANYNQVLNKHTGSLVHENEERQCKAQQCKARKRVQHSEIGVLAPEINLQVH